MQFEKLNLNEERLDLLENPFLGFYFRRKDQLLQNEIMIRRVNKLAIYYLNKDKKYDLDNYLQAKWITPLDFVRTVWYYVSKWTGYADVYRNEQFIPKSQFWYDHEAKILGINYNNPDTGQIAKNLLIALSFEI